MHEADWTGEGEVPTWSGRASQARKFDCTALCAPTVGPLHLAFVLRGCSEGEGPRTGTATVRLSESMSSLSEAARFELERPKRP